MFAITVGLIVGAVVPLFRHAKSSGNDAYQRGKGIGDMLENVLK
jgi:hypothetical protein